MWLGTCCKHAVLLLVGRRQQEVHLIWSRSNISYGTRWILHDEWARFTLVLFLILVLYHIFFPFLITVFFVLFVFVWFLFLVCNTNTMLEIIRLLLHVILWITVLASWYRNKSNQKSHLKSQLKLFNSQYRIPGKSRSWCWDDKLGSRCPSLGPTQRNPTTGNPGTGTRQQTGDL